MKSNELRIGSDWEIVCVDKDGNTKWVEEVSNRVVLQGVNAVLDIIFRSAGFTSQWYMGLKDDGVVASTDTMEIHPGWVELTDYVGDRKLTTFNPAGNNIIENNGLRPTFDITANDTIYGMFITDAESTSDPSDVLLSAINFTTARDVIIGDELKVSISYVLIGN